MNRLFRGLSPERRLALSVALIGAVHVGLVFFGNEDATPLKLLGSFGLASLMLVASFQIKKHLLQAAAARDAR